MDISAVSEVATIHSTDTNEYTEYTIYNIMVFAATNPKSLKIDYGIDDFGHFCHHHNLHLLQPQALHMRCTRNIQAWHRYIEIFKSSDKFSLLFLDMFS